MHWLTDWKTASMHAGAVVSIAAGKNCGVAPGADVFFLAARFPMVNNARFLIPPAARVH
jgi:hypothetical protein